MKNYHKTVLIFGILYFAALLAFVILTGSRSFTVTGRDTDIIKLNDIAKSAGNSWNDPGKLGETDYGIDFAVIDTADNVLYASYPADGTGLSLSSAMKKGCLYTCVTAGNKMVGYVILKDDCIGRWKDIRFKLIIGLAVIGVLLIAAAFLFVLLNQWIFRLSEQSLYDHTEYEAINIISASSIGAPLSTETRVDLFRRCEREGSTRGSLRLSSKLGSQSTVSLSMSRSISFEILLMRASV